MVQQNWVGTATELLSKINFLADEKREFHSRDQGWPKNPKALSDRLRRLAPALRGIGVEIIFTQTSGNNSHRQIEFRTLPKLCDAIDASSQIDSLCDESVEGAAKIHEVSKVTPPAQGTLELLDFNAV